MRKLFLFDGKIALQCDYSEKDMAKSIPGYKWQLEVKAWLYPLNLQIFHRLTALFPLDISEILLDAIDVLKEEAGKEERRITRATRIKEDKNSYVNDFCFKTDPYTHQKICFNFTRILDQSALLLEMGTGKTKIAIDVADYRYFKDQINNVLVVCPNCVVENWKREIVFHGTSTRDEDNIIMLTGSRQNRINLLKNYKSFC